MMTAKDRSCSRISRGSSTAATSSSSRTTSPATRRMRTFRRGDNVPRAGSSDMVPQHQLTGMRLEVDLAGEVLDRVDPDVVANQRDRNDQRHECVPVLLDT